MIKAIIPAVIFVAAGCILIIKRAQAAHGFSLIMGGTMPPIVMGLLGGTFLALAALTIVLYNTGVLG